MTIIALHKENSIFLFFPFSFIPCTYTKTLHITLYIICICIEIEIEENAREKSCKLVTYVNTVSIVGKNLAG